VSQILIRHRDVSSSLASCEPPFWSPEPKAPERTREQAFELASRLQRQAALGSTIFAELAKEHSDDVTTAARGGRMGALKPFASTSCPQILDALAVLRPGEVSRVIETSYGFHVLLRHAPPPEQRVSGSHIVIGYDEAPWLARHLAGRPVPPRSRAQAQALAEQAYRQIESDPGAFPRLVEQYSEHEDARRSGDFGSWSTREVTPFPREIQALSELRVGETAPPMDSLFGFQIIQRTPERPRELFAADRVEIAFDPKLRQTSTGAQAQAQKTALEIVQVLQRDLAALPGFQRKYCCESPLEWREGRDNPVYESTLARLSIGEVTREPVRTQDSYTVLVRRAPKSISETLANLDLPAPAEPDLAHLALTAAGPEPFERAAQAAVTRLNLGAAEATRYAELTAVQTRLAELSDEDARYAAFRQLQADLGALLGAARYRQFEEQVGQSLAEFVIEQARSEPLPVVEAL
jgi:hypothetical protein